MIMFVPCFAAAAVPVASWDFAVDDGGFSASGDTRQWEWGVPAGGPGGTDSLWATNLEGPYLHDAVDYLSGAVPDTTGVVRPVLEIAHWYEITSPDAGRVEFSDSGGPWVTIEPAYGYPDAAGFTGSSAGWSSAYFDLPPSVAGRVRFVIDADATFANEGWYLGGATLWDGSVVPPRVSLVSAPVDTQLIDGPFVVELEVVDDDALVGVTVTYAADDGPPVPVAAAPVSGDVWRAELPGQPPGTVVTWFAEATDGDHVTRFPEAAGADPSFRVYLAAPTGLVVPDGRLVGATLPISWIAPVSPEVPLDYSIWQGDALALAGVTDVVADVPIDPDGAATIAVSARYAAGEGDRCGAVPFVLEVPRIHEVSPAFGFPGEVVFIDVSGDALYLTDGSTASLGSGLTVDAVDVHDVGAATLTVTISSDAAPGPRALELTGAWGPVTLGGAFTVEPADDAPRITSVEPPSLAQGETVRFRIEASPGFFDTVTVEEAVDLVVADTPQRDGDTAVYVTLAAPGGAGVGLHTVVLDDGQRLWTTEVEVTPFRSAVLRSCASAPADLRGGAAIVAVAALAVCRRRRLTS
jgi:hypothetical protein